jgi:hypothetical protein
MKLGFEGVTIVGFNIRVLQYATIPGGVTGFFSDIYPSDRSMVLGSTQPLVKMSTRNIPGGKGGQCVGLTTSPPSHPECHEIWEPKPPGTLWATPGLLRDSLQYAKPSLVLEEVTMDSLSPAKLDCLSICQTTCRHILEDSTLICV